MYIRLMNQGMFISEISRSRKKMQGCVFFLRDHIIKELGFLIVNKSEVIVSGMGRNPL